MGVCFVLLSVVLAIFLVAFNEIAVEGRSHLAKRKRSESQFGLTAINCSLESKTTEISTLASLTILGSRQHRGKEEFDVLATVDMWSNVPMLGSELMETDVSLTGRIEEKPTTNSALTLSWNSATTLCRHTYKCVANGYNRKWRPISVVTTVELGHLARGKCHKKIHSIASQVQRLTEVVEVTARASAEITEQVQGQNSKLRDLESTLSAVHVTTRLLTTLINIDRSKYHISGVYGDRIYLVSRSVKDFNLETDDQACVTEGGYLAEIDDDRESQFVLSFVLTLSDTTVFMTGANDKEREGRFVFYHSKRAMPRVTWLTNQPDNYGHGEDCVQFSTIRGWNGLNDVRCNYRGKYICEVPLHA